MSDETDAPDPRLARAGWLRAVETRRVLDALEREGHRARIVGGAVRNTLLGLPVTDIDIATDAPPETVMRLAESAGLGVVPTGLRHGTVTIVANHHPFEVTTLRHDVDTDGRHATVAFTDDWHADAARRDFTINALYCDKRGHLFDPAGGLRDLERRRVRFIGDPHARIREDFLRILRFFRFSAEYSEGPLDAEGLAACMSERAGLQRLSAERVRAELLKLLAARGVLASIEAMAGSGLLAPLIGRAGDVVSLRRMVAIAQHLRRVGVAAPAAATLEADRQRLALVRLAALALDDKAAAADLMQRLRLSRAEADHLAATGAAAALLAERGPARGPADAPPAAPRIRAVMYRHGTAAGLDGLLLHWSRSPAATDSPAWTALLAAAAGWSPPAMPFTGADLLALGVAPGRRVGELLREFEAWWIGADFPLDEALLKDRLARIVDG